MSLTDEDKAWIGTQLERLTERIMDRVQTSVTVSEHRMTETIRGVETSLLTEFHSWAGPVDMRIRNHSAVLHALDLERQYPADSVTKLERPIGQ